MIFQAGLITDVMSTKLIIALEPEAASMYCKHVDLGGSKEKTSKDQEIYFGINDNYMVIDAGGMIMSHFIHHDKI